MTAPEMVDRWLADRDAHLADLASSALRLVDDRGRRWVHDAVRDLWLHNAGPSCPDTCAPGHGTFGWPLALIPVDAGPVCTPCARGAHMSCTWQGCQCPCTQRLPAGPAGTAPPDGG